MQATNAAMTQLKLAIDRRLRMEQEFLYKMVDKFRAITQKLAQSVSKEDLDPHIQALEAATEQLENGYDGYKPDNGPINPNDGTNGEFLPWGNFRAGPHIGGRSRKRRK